MAGRTRPGDFRGFSSTSLPVLRNGNNQHFITRSQSARRYHQDKGQQHRRPGWEATRRCPAGPGRGASVLRISITEHCPRRRARHELTDEDSGVHRKGAASVLKGHLTTKSAAPAPRGGCPCLSGAERPCAVWRGRSSLGGRMARVPNRPRFGYDAHGKTAFLNKPELGPTQMLPDLEPGDDAEPTSAY
jgi:hypothetical protein